LVIIAMATRSSWKGYLRLSLVTVPVEGVNAASPVAESGVPLHQLHSTCLSRIRYQKVCPIHGEVPNDEIVLGYERSKGEYAVVDKAEVNEIKSGGDRSISIDAFVSPDQIDPLVFEGRSYYLLPEGEVARKPYAVLAKAIAAEKCYGIGRGFFWGRDRLVLIRSLGETLCMEMLHFDSELAERANIPQEMHLPEVTKEELRLASKLIEASTVKHLDLAKYDDTTTQKLKELVASKDVEQPAEAPDDERQPPVVNLMDALKRSVAKAGGRTAAGAPSRSRTPKRRKPAARRHAG
jgi:DNA end-binding protein Ku